ncbi:ThuA domain-containing protein [Candidatus Latescibacterota bacterium]
MRSNNKISRRNIIKAGAAAGIAGSVTAIESESQARNFEKTDQPTIVAYMGQHCHNPIMLELNLRGTLAKMNWRVLFTQYGELFTPELIDIADVCLTFAGNTNNNGNFYKDFAVGYVPEGVVEKRPPSGKFMREDQERAIHENVQNRGMGFLSLHNSIYRPRPLIMNMLDCEWAMHTPIQNVMYWKFNNSHPITRGIEPFMESDEQFFSRNHNPGHTILFESKGADYNHETVSGWCGDYGKGRFVSLLPGHTEFVWRNPGWQQLVLRSCLWLMKMPIPENTLELVEAQRPYSGDYGKITWQK